MDFAQLISSGPDGLRGSLPEVPISPHETAIRNIDNRGRHTDRNGQLNRNGSPTIVYTAELPAGYNLSLSPIRSRPVDPPPPAGKRHPAEPLRRRRARVVVQRRGALVESARMRRFHKSEPFAIQMVAKLMAERRKKRTK